MHADLKTIAPYLGQAETEGRASQIRTVGDLGLGVEYTKDPFTKREYLLVYTPGDSENAWHLISSGPDRAYDFQPDPFNYISYDPTNGTVSRGDIVLSVKREP